MEKTIHEKVMGTCLEGAPSFRRPSWSEKFSKGEATFNEALEGIERDFRQSLSMIGARPAPTNRLLNKNEITTR